MARKKDDDWVGAALGLGLGVLALYFLKKLSDGTDKNTKKVCTYCGHITEKWSRACPNCRNTFSL